MRNIDENANANTIEGIIGKSTYNMIEGFGRFVIRICEKFSQYEWAIKIATWSLTKIIDGKELDSRSATVTENDISRAIGQLENKLTANLRQGALQTNSPEDSQRLLQELRAGSNAGLSRIVNQAKQANDPKILTDVLDKLNSKDLLQLLQEKPHNFSYERSVIRWLIKDPQVATETITHILGRLDSNGLRQIIMPESKTPDCVTLHRLWEKSGENSKIVTDMLGKLNSGDLVKILLNSKYNNPLHFLPSQDLIDMLNMLIHEDLLQVLQNCGDGPGILLNLSPKLYFNDLVPLLDKLAPDELLKVINGGHVKLDKGRSISFVDAFLGEADRNPKILADVLGKLDSANLLKALQEHDGKILKHITSRGFEYVADILSGLNPSDLKQVLVANGNYLLNFVLDNGERYPGKLISLLSGLSYGALKEVCEMEPVGERVHTILGRDDVAASPMAAEINRALNPESRPVAANRLGSEASLANFIAEFANLGICETPKEAVELNTLITLLHEKSPEMLVGILDNCQWLKGKGQDTFIHSIAVESMQMELVDIFDQKGFDALPNGANPLSAIMLGSHGGDGRNGYSVFDKETDRVLRNTWNNFARWINGQSKLPSQLGQATTQDRVFAKLGSNWERTLGIGQLRKGVQDNILLARDPDGELEALYQEVEQKVQSNPGNRCANDFFQEFQVASAYASTQYAYTQLLLRHATLPGQDKGPPPTLLAVRKVHSESLGKIVGHDIQPNGKEQFTYHAEGALAAESWAIVSAVNGPENKIYGDSAIYGRVPVYSILTSFFSQKQGVLGRARGMWSPAQKELVVLPFSDIELTAERNFDELTYTKDVVLPAMEQQYGSSNEAFVGARNSVISVERLKKERNEQNENHKGNLRVGQ
jgi:hypothetical protein